MTQREKLIELLDQNFGYVEEQPAKNLADYLIANGVVVPVRCEDCEYHDNFGRYGTYVGADVHYCNRLKFGTRDSEFCSYGERKGCGE